MEKYAIGLDFGSLSARALAVNTKNGRETESVVFEYPHGILELALPCGEPLPKGYALQHPRDYLAALFFLIPELMRRTGLAKEQIIGIGLDATASTVMPVTKEGRPLCFLPEYEKEIHAYPKLWKHHAAQGYARRMTEAAKEEDWIGLYGGRISAEWALPKFFQVFEEAPGICEKMAYFMEAGDWLVWQLTGNAVSSACSAGYKTLYRIGEGYPGSAYFARLSPGLEKAFAEKYTLPVLPLGALAGGLKKELAEKLGLCPGTAVAVSGIDGHTCAFSAGRLESGTMVAILGTSAGHMLLSRERKTVPGICGAAADGLLPGMIAYEAGQNAVGDLFAWVTSRLCPGEYREAAEKQGLSLHEYLTALAGKLMPGESGLLALDWWNGNRSTLMDADLTGLMIGMTLQTRCEEIYRALMEAAAFGTRMIVENFREHGVPVEKFIASGGISHKNPLLMQILADVLKMPVYIAECRQTSALGSAVYGAVAAGKTKGGWDDLNEAAAAMGRVSDQIYRPMPENAAVYEQLYGEYRSLYELFGGGGMNTMKKLKALQKGIC